METSRAALQPSVAPEVRINSFNTSCVIAAELLTLGHAAPPFKSFSAKQL